jgi:hypothetical protein
MAITTFTANPGFLFIPASGLGVNVNATSFTESATAIGNVANLKFGGFGNLDGFGSFNLTYMGTGSGTTGGFTTTGFSAVPGPIEGRGLPALILGCGALLYLARRRHQKFAITS